MLRKKLGKEPPKTTTVAPNTKTQTTPSLTNQQNSSQVQISKQKIAQILLQKQRIENKQKQIVSKIAQGTGKKRYHQEFQGFLQANLDKKNAKKHRAVIGKGLFEYEENKGLFKSENYL